MGLYNSVCSIAYALHVGSRVKKDCRYAFAALLFASWDHNVITKDAVKTLSKTIGNTFKVTLETYAKYRLMRQT